MRKSGRGSARCYMDCGHKEDIGWNVQCRESVSRQTGWRHTEPLTPVGGESTVVWSGDSVTGKLVGKMWG